MTPEQKILAELVQDVRQTGGLISYPDGTFAPAADPDWIDLAETVRRAEQLLLKTGVITEPLPIHEEEA